MDFSKFVLKFSAKFDKKAVILLESVELSKASAKLGKRALPLTCSSFEASQHPLGKTMHFFNTLQSILSCSMESRLELSFATVSFPSTFRSFHAIPVHIDLQLHRH